MSDRIIHINGKKYRVEIEGSNLSFFSDAKGNLGDFSPTYFYWDGKLLGSITKEKTANNTRIKGFTVDGSDWNRYAEASPEILIYAAKSILGEAGYLFVDQVSDC